MTSPLSTSDKYNYTLKSTRTWGWELDRFSSCDLLVLISSLRKLARQISPAQLQPVMTNAQRNNRCESKSALKTQVKTVISDFGVFIVFELLCQNLNALSCNFQEKRIQVTKVCSLLNAPKSKWPLISPVL